MPPVGIQQYYQGRTFKEAAELDGWQLMRSWCLDLARRAVREALQRSSSPASSSDKEVQALIVEGAPPSERLPSAKSSASAVGSAHADTVADVV